jgi:hypothetical protein
MQNTPKSIQNQLKDKASEMKKKAEAKLNKYKNPGNIKKKAAELFKTDKVKTLGASAISGALALIVTGQGTNLANLHSKANTLGEIDKIASVEKTTAKVALETSRKGIKDFTNQADFGKKSLASTMEDFALKSAEVQNEQDQKVVKQIAQNLPVDDEGATDRVAKYEEFVKQTKLDATDLGTANNNLLYSSLKNKDSVVTSLVDIETTRVLETPEQAILKSKLEALETKVNINAQLENVLDKTERRYTAGRTAEAFMEADNLKKEADKNAAGTILIGGALGGVVSEYLKKKKKNGENEELQEEKIELKPEEPEVPYNNSDSIIAAEEVQNQIEVNTDTVVVSPALEPMANEAKKPNAFQRFGKVATNAVMGGMLTMGAVKGVELFQNHQPLINSGASTEQVNINTEGQVDSTESINTPEKAAIWAKDTYTEKLQDSVNRDKKYLEDLDVELKDYLTKAYGPNGDVSEAAIESRKGSVESRKGRGQIELEKSIAKLEEFKSIDLTKTKLHKEIATYIVDKAKYTSQNEQTIASVTALIEKNQSLPDVVVQATVTESPQPTQSPEAVTTAESRVQVNNNTGDAIYQQNPVVEKTQQTTVNVPTPKPHPLAYAPKNQEYLSARAKIEAFAKQSGTTEQLSQYTDFIADQIITNLKATLAEKGSTMSSEEQSILMAKVSAWKYIKNHNSASELYISLENAAPDQKYTFLKAASGNPKSIFLKVRYDNLNAADIANYNFDGVSFESYAREHGFKNASANMARIAELRK